uniref:F-box domain-containing protein n=1 Tax=Mycena chlorophos TaxID=658473 RepID=A0ABQ0LZG6_MYCCL|nr:predicted protein [Mycena chlorophos]
MSGRRQSARLSAAKTRKDVSENGTTAQSGGGNASRAKTTSPPKGSMSEDDWDDGDESPADEDDGMDSTREGDYEGRRPAKKQKLYKSPPKTGKQTKTARSTGKGRKSNKDCLLVELPLDILFEIFGQCPPQDLISLSRTSHLLRSHLLSEASRTIWRAAREYADGPPVAPGMTEQQWAHILFGKPRFQSCNAPNIHRVDYGLQRRACVKCLKLNLVVTSRFSRVFPELDASILDLLRYTNIGGHSHGHASNSRFYWQKDIEDMTLELEKLDQDIEAGISDAAKKHTFIAERKELIKAINQHALICLTWTINASLRREEEKAEMMRKRFNDIKTKFMEMGYAEEDIEAIKDTSSVRQATVLTDRGWKIIRSSLETEIRATKTKRLRNERFRISNKLYDAYKRGLNASQRRTLPQESDIFDHPAFKGILDSENDDAKSTEADFASTVALLPEIVSSIQVARSAQLLELIQQPPAGPVREDAEPGDIPPSLPHPHAVDSALAVFVCKRGCRYLSWMRGNRNAAPAYIGQDSAATHNCAASPYYPWHHTEPSVKTVFELSERGVRAAAALVQTVGLNDRATCAQMDALNARFLCKTCTPTRSGGGLNYAVYSWRSAIIHFVSLHVDKQVPQWERLDDARAESLKQAETDTTLAWACNHCAEHIERCETRTKVIEHIKTKHDIAEPAVPHDLVRMLDLEQTPAMVHIPGPGSKAEFNCLRCEGTASRARLFILDGVKSHLKAKHKVGAPVEGRDWKKSPNV